MGSSIIRGKYVICKVTGPDSAQVITDGAIFQRDGEITELGRYDDLRANHPHEKVIGSRDYVVMPGLVNDHFHVGLTPFQLGAPDLPLELWIIARMSARDVDPYLDQLYGAIQMIESGTTTVQAIHRAGGPRSPVSMDVADKAIKAYQDSGMRVSYAASLGNQNLLGAGASGGDDAFLSQLPSDLAQRYQSHMSAIYVSTEDIVSFAEELSEKYGGGRYERVRVTLAPRNVHCCSDELLMAFKELSTKHDTGMHIHLAETVYQKLHGLGAWGTTPLQHLNDLGFLGPELTCGHSVWITDEDIEIMASVGASVCHNASSNLRLQSGIAPVNRLLERGIRVAIGSDEAGINDDKDLLQEMRLVLSLNRVPGVDNVAPTAHQVFEMATVNGAHASWFGDRIGTLEIGKRADVVLLRLENIEEPYLDASVSIVDAVVHRGRNTDVDTVVVDGELIMRDRKFTRIDKDAVFREISASLAGPRQPHEVQRRELAAQLAPYMHRFHSGTAGDLGAPHYIYASPAISVDPLEGETATV